MLIRETPITAQAITAELIEQRASEDLGAAVKNITGVRPINRYGGFQTFRIRGFNNFVLLNDEVAAQHLYERPEFKSGQYRASGSGKGAGFSAIRSFWRIKFGA